MNLKQGNEAPATLTSGLTTLLALAVGIMAANLYYAQPLTAQIAKSLGLAPSVAGLVVTLTQMGYGAGVLFFVPLGDLVENKRLILTFLAIAIVAILGVAFATTMLPYFISTFVLGFGVSAVQMIVPFAAHLAPEHRRGQVVGNLMGGLMIGIMLSRPISGFLTDLISWHAVFYLSAGLMTLIAICLYYFLPSRQPNTRGLRYSTLILSMGGLVLTHSILRRRAFYQACMFSAFCLFWTATPLLLAGPEFHLSPSGIALFALVGVSGAVLAPVAGKVADRGWTRMGSALGMGAGVLAFLVTLIAPLGSNLSLALLTLAAVLLDAGVSSNLVMGQRAIFTLPAEYRGRLNSIYIAIIFLGGAFGSFVGAWAYAHGAWPLTAWIGFALPFSALAYFVTESQQRRA